MTDLDIGIASGSDDGYCVTEISTSIKTFNRTFALGRLGNTGTSIYDASYFRFQNVTIPAGVQINSAYLGLDPTITTSDATCRVNIHFEDEDDTTVPSSCTDLLSRNLTAAVAWEIPGTTNQVQYNTPDLSAILQDVIDRAGWNSGQSVTVHIVDNGSDLYADRTYACYESSTYTEARLIVNYSFPYTIDVSESIAISEDINFESDLIRQDNIGISEDVTVLLAFSGELPISSENIEVTESVTILRGLGTIPVQSENIEISEALDLLLGFTGSLPDMFESIDINELIGVDVGPQITVFESITVNDYGNIQPEFSVSDNLSLTESVTVRRGYQVAVDDSALFSDTFTIFNYTSWFRRNKAKSKERFFFTLTGATDNTTDIEIPVSSIYATKRSGDPSYLQVVVPSLNYSGEIAIRSNAQMIVDIGYEVDGVINLREQILISDLEDIRVDEGPINRSVTLSGHRTIDYGGNLVTFSRADITYRAVQTRARVFRFAFIDPFLNPGDTVVIDYESFTCNNIVYIINPRSSMMEVREAL